MPEFDVEGVTIHKSASARGWLRFHLQICLLNVQNSLPCIKAFDDESIQILFKTKASKNDGEFGHSSAGDWRLEDSSVVLYIGVK